MKSQAGGWDPESPEAVAKKDVVDIDGDPSRGNETEKIIDKEAEGVLVARTDRDAVP